MRLFVALPLATEIRRMLARHTERVRPSLPAARWLPSENLHLTLRFLGEVEATELDAARKALARAVEGRTGFDLALGEPGRFPRRGPPRVLWIGVEAGTALFELQSAISSALEEALDLEQERRAYHPHVTLGRCRDLWRRSDAELWTNETFAGTGESFGVTYVDLMESRLSPAGATHDRVDRLPLEPMC
ncbi:MAG: RNA 2',3'-cyclic phosphodiesterase [Thermoanaerobaculia bacterium]|nr:RNA 2',3'-cyclic phosphodiesterase [Thermoanaerobaculia bacterium]